jgi:hypothetical protein
MTVAEPMVRPLHGLLLSGLPQRLQDLLQAGDFRPCSALKK